jgi:LysR family transcriptional activator of nhaA
MERLNYHHLFYFWMVAREGGVARAARALGLSQPTLSGQIRSLEEFLGAPLFTRVGRGLEPTETGRLVQRYADEIFGLGREMLDTLRDRPTGRPIAFTVGVADVLPKLVAQRLLEPALRLPTPVRLTVREDRVDRLFAALAIHELDLVLTDAPPAAGAPLRAYPHLLGACDVALYAPPAMARRLKPRFPESLAGAPILLPLEGTAIRRQVDAWLDRREIRPQVVGEFEDSALMKSFGQAGFGVVASPVVIEREMRAQYGLRRIGVLSGVRERFFAVSVERRIKHPAVLELTRVARQDLFG